MLFDILSVASVLVGSLIAIGSLVIFFNRRLLKHQPDPWLTRTNQLMLATDLIWGVGMIFLVWLSDKYYLYAIYHWIILMVMTSHLYRWWESKSSILNVFSWSDRLICWNYIKLILIAGLEVIAVAAILLLK